MTSDESEMRGFDDATDFLLDLREGVSRDEALGRRYRPPEGKPGCDGESEIVDRECLRCRYHIGWFDGVGK